MYVCMYVFRSVSARINRSPLVGRCTWSPHAAVHADTDFSMESSLPDSFSCDSAGSDNLPDSAEFDVPEPLHEEREPAEPASGSRDPAPNQGPAEPASGSRDPAPNQAVPEAINLRHW